MSMLTEILHKELFACASSASTNTYYMALLITSIIADRSIC